LLTALLAGILGAGLAALAVRAFLLRAPAGSEHWNDIPRLHEIALDERSLLFILGLTFATAVIFGTLPARRGAQAAAEAATGTRITAGRHTLRAQAALVTGEIGIAVLLVAVSGLLLNSLLQTLRVQPGFDGQDVVVAEVRPPVTSNSHASDLSFYGTLLERTRALPGVSQAALARTTPGIAGGDWSRVTADHQQNANQSEPSRAAAIGSRPGDGFYRTNVVQGEFFGVLDIPVLTGRTFDDEPGPTDPLVVVLNRAAARHFFPGVEVPIGRRVSLGPPGSASPMREVIGIVGDVRQQSATDEPEPQIYLPFGQRNVSRMSLVIEAQPGTIIRAEAIRSLVHELAPDLPVDRIEWLAARYASTAAQDRFLAWLLSAFGLIGLALSAMGTYATTSQALSYRMREMGIRFALGARAAGVFRLILMRALIIAALGIAIGLVATLIISRLIEAHVFGITARDPLTLLAASGLMAVSAAFAALRPALRAASLDPNAVLRRG
jgi:putative ABC transport system permease protein